MTLIRERIAVLIPCYNEGLTVKKVIEDFRRELPFADIYVFDNNSVDNTHQEAIDAGAIVISEKRQGKGFVIAAMFNKIDADFYVMVDGDDTYSAAYVQQLLEPLLAGKADMVVGQRLSVYEQAAFRNLHVWGNKLVCNIINLIFSTNLLDPMSGFRAFTREVVTNLPIIAAGFDVETEMTLQLLYRNFVIKEINVPYRARPAGSVSKLNTFRDGFRVMLKILNIARAYKPMTFFGMLAIFSSLAGLAAGYVPIVEYIEFRYVYSVPRAILASGLQIIAILLVGVGMIISTINFRILELSVLISKQLYTQPMPRNAAIYERKLPQLLDDH